TGTWTQTEVISTESTRSSCVPTIAIDRFGNLHVTWEDKTNYGGAGVDRDIFYKRWNATLDTWTTTEVVSTESTDDSGDPTIAVDGSGNIHIVWHENSSYGNSGTDYDTFCKHFNASTGTWTITEVVTKESTNHALWPSIATDGAGHLHVVWRDYSNYNGAGTDLDTFYKCWNATTGTWTPPEVVSTGSTYDIHFPTLAVDTFGSVHVVWDEYNYDGDIFYKKKVGILNAPTLDAIVPNPETDGIINLNWNDMLGATTYYVYRATSPITSVSGMTPLATVSMTNYQDPIFKNGIYYYVIVAGNPSGNSSISNCEHVEVVKLHPLFDGMYINYTCSLRIGITGVHRTIDYLGPYQYNFIYSHVSNGTFHVMDIQDGDGSWDIDTRTRIMSSSPFASGFVFCFHSEKPYYTPFWIFTNVTLGDVVLFDEGNYGVYDVTHKQIYNIPGIGSVEVWVLEDREFGVEVWYEKSTGILLKGQFPHSYMVDPAFYTFEFMGTNAEFNILNYSPELALGSVNPESGNQNTQFNFSVVYTDQDNEHPEYINVLINEIPYSMEKQNSSDVNYTDGCLYHYSTYLLPGDYTYLFECNDGIFTDSTITSELVVTYSFSNPPILDPISPNPDDDDELIELNWTNVSGATAYYVYRDISSITVVDEMTPIATVSTNSYQDTVTTSGIYYYVIVAGNPSGNSSVSNCERVEVAKLHPLFDGMFIQYDITHGMAGSWRGIFNYSHTSDSIFHVTNEFGEDLYDVNGRNRVVSNSSTDKIDFEGSHTPIWIFPNVSLGDIVPIGIIGLDFSFTVINESSKLLPGVGLVEYWVLDGGNHRELWYEKSTGILLEGRINPNGMFAHAILAMLFDFVDSNIPFLMDSADITPPNPPELDPISPNPNTDGIIALNWSEVAEATSYYIYRNTSTITSVAGLTSIANISTTTYQDPIFKNGIYYYVIVAGNLSGNSSISNCESVEVAKLHPLFDGLYMNYTCEISFFGEITWDPSYSHVSSSIFHISGLFNGSKSWDVDVQNRFIINSSSGFMQYKIHTPHWIFPNVSLGDEIIIGIPIQPGQDHVFTVANELIYDLPGFGPVEAWCLTDTGNGREAWYEKSTGILLKGRLHLYGWVGPGMILELFGTNANFNLLNNTAPSLNPPVLDPISPNPDTDGIITLNWSEVAEATSYYIYRNTLPLTSVAGLTPIANISTTTYQDPIFKNGIYYYVIVAGNPSGNSSISNCEHVEVKKVYAFNITVFDHVYGNHMNLPSRNFTIPDVPIRSCRMQLTAYCDPDDGHTRAVEFYLDGIPTTRGLIGTSGSCSMVHGDTIRPGQTVTRYYNMSHVQYANTTTYQGHYYINFLPQGPSDTLGYLSSGNHTIRSYVTSVDWEKGATQDSWVSITLIFNEEYAIDSTVPITATITSPGIGDVARGIVNITAAATDFETGVERVEFWIGPPGTGLLLGIDNWASYSYAWNTIFASDGFYDLYVRVYDFAGNYLDSSGLTIKVNNTEINPDDYAPVLMPIVPNPDDDGIIALNWSELLGATTYDIYRDTTPITSVDSMIPIATVSTTTYQDSLFNNGIYFYVIVAGNSLGNSPISNCESVEVAKLHPLFDGMFVNYNYNITDLSGNLVLDSGESNFIYSHLSENNFHVTDASEGRSWDINAQNRIIENTSNVPWFGDNVHTPLWIFTNVSLGDSIPIGLPYDHNFRVSGTLIYNLPGFGPVEVWVLEDQTSWGSLWYEKSTGLLLNGTSINNRILGMEILFTFEFVDTNVEFNILNYFSPELTLGAVVPESGKQNTEFNFSVVYSDQYNDPPAYINVLINGTPHPMEKQDLSDLNYTDGCLYQYTTYLSPGNYSYYFECSNGVNSNSTNIKNLVVNPANLYAPEFGRRYAIAYRGTSSTLFHIHAIYKDLDNDPPTYVNVIINGTTYRMTKAQSSDSNYTDGCEYQYQIYLTRANYIFVYECSDGQYYNSTRPFVLHLPTVSECSVTPSRGTNSTLFTFTAVYTSLNNLKPEFVRVKLDGISHSMVKQNQSDSNYVDGCLFQYQSYFEPGTTRYSFECSDGVFKTSTNVFELIVTNSFPDDTRPPEVSNLSPGNGTYINDKSPIQIRVDLSDDLSGINTSTIVLRVDGYVCTHGWDGTSVTLSGPLPFLNGQTIEIRLDASDLAGNAMDTYICSYTFDNTPPYGFTISNPSESVADTAPEVICQFQLSTAGINLSSVQYAYSTTGSPTPTNWAPVDGVYLDAACTIPAGEGATGVLYLKVNNVPFNQYSLTNNTIRFRAADTANNLGIQSVAIPIETVEAKAPAPNLLVIIIIIILGAIATGAYISNSAVHNRRHEQEIKYLLNKVLNEPIVPYFVAPIPSSESQEIFDTQIEPMEGDAEATGDGGSSYPVENFEPSIEASEASPEVLAQVNLNESYYFTFLRLSRVFHLFVNSFPALTVLFPMDERLSDLMDLKDLPDERLHALFATLLTKVPQSEVLSQLSILLNKLKESEELKYPSSIIAKNERLIDMAISLNDHTLLNDLYQLMVLIECS
ncbi:MAG: Ig-like domain-containing protein, partial [Candidatus Helarchaeota archaeon]|nr:Ig-like domain-containing protein [Candidatus Helarchaeota archaeon]